MADENTQNLPAAKKPADPSIDLSGGSMFFVPAKFEHAYRVAKVLAMSPMVPEHFRGEQNIGSVMIALNFAERAGLDPFMTMQSMYVVHGRPGIEAKLAIALVNNTGRFSPLRFRLEGEGKSRKCTCYAQEKATGETCEQTVTMAMAEAEGWVSKSGSKWKTMPDLMLQYRSATFFARLYCPEALLGFQTKEEIYDAVDLVPGEDGAYRVNQPSALAAEAAQKSRRGRPRAADKPQEPPQDQPTKAPEPEAQSGPGLPAEAPSTPQDAGDAYMDALEHVKDALAGLTREQREKALAACGKPWPKTAAECSQVIDAANAAKES